MLSLHTNAASLSTQNALAFNNKSLSTSMTKLGTGFRINSAMDDAAGLQIANRLKAQQSGMAVAMRNTQNAISLMQTAEGSLSEVNTMLVRMKDLATQSADASASDDDKVAMQAEYDSLAQEISNIMGNTTFGGEKLMNKAPSVSAQATALISKETLTADLGAAGDASTEPSLYGLQALAQETFDDAKADWEVDTASKTDEVLTEAYINASKDLEQAKLNTQAGVDKLAEATRYEAALAAAPTEDGKFASALNFQIGSTGSEVMVLNLDSNLSQLHQALEAVSKNYSSAGLTTNSVKGDELTADGSANGKLDELQSILDRVGELRSALGAASNRLQHTNANLGNMSTNTQAAIGRIMDVDYATETSNMTKNQMLMQSSTAMLKQSNSLSQMVASLLQ